MRIDELDIIKVNNSINIERWNDTLTTLCKKINLDVEFKLPLENGYIRFESDSFDVQFENRNEYVRMIMYWNHDENQNRLDYADSNAKAVSFRYYTNTREFHNVVYPLKHIDALKEMFDDGRMIKRMTEKFHALMNYAVYGEQIVEKKSKVSKSIKRPSTTQSSHSSNSHNLVRKTYVINDITGENKQATDCNLEQSVKRSYKKITSEWTVKGHYRKYRNGKVTWVKPYVKGDGNNNKTNKIYKV